MCWRLDGSNKGSVMIRINICDQVATIEIDVTEKEPEKKPMPLPPSKAVWTEESKPMGDPIPGTPAPQPGKYDDLAKEFATAFFQPKGRDLIFKSFTKHCLLPMPDEWNDEQRSECVHWLNEELSNRIAKAIEWTKNPKNKL
jgi:hypothetical protein